MIISRKFHQYLCKTLLYRPWRAYRQRQQLQRFNFLLDNYVRMDKVKEPYSEILTRDRLRLKHSQRRPFFGQDRKPAIVAFGAKDWEQYGLYPSFDRLCHFLLYEYVKEAMETFSCRRIGPKMREDINRHFLDFIDNLDKRQNITCVFFYVAGFYISNWLLKELAKRGIWTVIMSLDDKHQFNFNGKKGVSDQLRVASLCDLYWTTWKIGTHIVLSVGGTPWYAPEAADPNYHYPLDIEKDIDVLFIGQSYGLRADLIKYLLKRDINLTVFGAGWPNGFASFEETIRLYNRAKIVLGIGGVGHTYEVKHLKGRDFEVPMCGALYLTSYNHELADFFEIGREILCYSSFEECFETIQWILRRPDEAQQIRESAIKRALKDHTWERRLNRFFSLFP